MALPRAASQQCGVCLLAECPVLRLPPLRVTADLVRTWAMEGRTTATSCVMHCVMHCVVHCVVHCVMPCTAYYGCAPMVQLMVDEIARTPGTLRACLQSWYLWGEPTYSLGTCLDTCGCSLVTQGCSLGA